MGLMDKVKAQATQLAQKTQETARDSMAKLDQAQGKRRGDAMLRNLGALVYAERTGRGTPDTQQQVDRLVADISAQEAENGLSLAPEPTDQPSAGPAGSASPEPTGAPSTWYPAAAPEPPAEFHSGPASASAYPSAPEPAPAPAYPSSAAYPPVPEAEPASAYPPAPESEPAPAYPPEPAPEPEPAPTSAGPAEAFPPAAPTGFPPEAG